MRSYLLSFPVLLVAFCGLKIELPVQNPQVPASVVWAGGVDGGSWIDCKMSEEEDLVSCSVYEDTTGELGARGLFAPVDPSAMEYVRKRKFTAYDGEKII